MTLLDKQRFRGPGGVQYTAWDTTAFGPARPLDLALLEALNTAPAWLTQSERLLLFSLVYALRPRCYLEVGVLHGGAALIASAAMDAAGHDGRMVLIDPEPQIEPEHWARMAGRAHLIRGYSPAALPEARELAGGPFDLVLIDASHATRAVLRDAEALLPYLEDGAHLLFHDSYRNEVDRAINQFRCLHLDSLVDFGTLTREFHRSGQENGGGGAPGRTISCGMRMMEFRRNLARNRMADRWNGFGARTRKLGHSLKRRLRGRSDGAGTGAPKG